MNEYSFLLFQYNFTSSILICNINIDTSTLIYHIYSNYVIYSWQKLKWVKNVYSKILSKTVDQGTGNETGIRSQPSKGIMALLLQKYRLWSNYLICLCLN